MTKTMELQTQRKLPIKDHEKHNQRLETCFTKVPRELNPRQQQFRESVESCQSVQNLVAARRHISEKNKILMSQKCP